MIEEQLIREEFERSKGEEMARFEEEKVFFSFFLLIIMPKGFIHHCFLFAILSFSMHVFL